MKPLLFITREIRRIAPAPGARSAFTVSGVHTSSDDGFDQDGDLPDDLVTERTVVRHVGLRKMLDTNTGIAGSFIRFLTKEFSVENWRYYWEVNQLREQYGGWRQKDAGKSGLESGSLEWFKGAPTPTQLIALRDDINRIFSLHLATKAPFEINLSSSLLQSIRACFGPDGTARADREEYVPMLFCQAQDQIYDLMKIDSYERFKRSVDFDHNSLALV